MSATAAQLAELRLMVAEPLTTTYSDVLLQGKIEEYPCVDERGEEPYTWLLTSPPTTSENTEWIATYDLHAAAADVWQWKAAALADKFNVTADGSTLNRSDLYKQAMSQARSHRAQRKIRTVRAWKSPKELNLERSQIFNLAQDDD